MTDEMNTHEGHHPGHEHSGHEHAEHGMGQDDEPDFHGMLLFGEKRAFMSHLPMIAHPHHDFQVLMEVRLLDADGNPGPEEQYLADRQTSGARLYTLAPTENFVLTELFSDQETQGRTSFPAAIWRGHFERSGKQLLVPDAQVQIERTFHFRQFDSQEEPLEDLTYISFGSGGERFLAHRITRAPDFDQILKVEVLDTDLSQNHIDNGLSLMVMQGRPNTVKDRLRAGENIGGVFNFLGHPHKVLMNVIDELYLEESELRARPDFGQSEEEIDAGF